VARRRFESRGNINRLVEKRLGSNYSQASSPTVAIKLSVVSFSGSAMGEAYLHLSDRRFASFEAVHTHRKFNNFQEDHGRTGPRSKSKNCVARSEQLRVVCVLKGSFNGDGAVVSYLVRTKEITMKLTIIALASAITLCSTAAIAHTVRHDSHVRSSPIYRDAAPQVALHPNYGNPNGNPDGPTTLSGTGNSQFGGSSPGTSGYN
jgi:hypothetical protein